MKKHFLILIACLAGVLHVSAATEVYTRVNNKPTEGWAGTYLMVYEKSDTEAYVWNGEDEKNNYVSITIADGKITDANGALSDYRVTVSAEGSNRFYVKAKNGYIGTDATKNGLNFYSGGRECTIQSNGGYVMLETNTNTCRFLCYESSGAYRFRFYYDATKKWTDSKKHNISFYVLGDVTQEEPQNQLDLQYAHAEMYACGSKFPTQNNPYDQYFLTYLFLAQEEDYEAVPQVWLEILAPTQYSLEGTYRSDYTPGKKYFINCQAGSKHSYFIFPNKSELGYGQAAINLATMKITKVGKSPYANAYVYHIRLEFTDSNKKIWTLDKDMHVYGWWSDCNRSGDEDVDMTPVPFAFESGNHNSTEDVKAMESGTRNVESQKVFRDGQIVIEREGKVYNVLGVEL